MVKPEDDVIEPEDDVEGTEMTDEEGDSSVKHWNDSWITGMTVGSLE